MHTVAPLKRKNPAFSVEKGPAEKVPTKVSWENESCHVNSGVPPNSGAVAKTTVGNDCLFTGFYPVDPSQPPGDEGALPIAQRGGSVGTHRAPLAPASASEQHTWIDVSQNGCFPEHNLGKPRDNYELGHSQRAISSNIQIGGEMSNIFPHTISAFLYWGSRVSYDVVNCVCEHFCHPCGYWECQN